jgi:hypothetical protein
MEEAGNKKSAHCNSETESHPQIAHGRILLTLKLQKISGVHWGSDEKWLVCDTFKHLTWPARRTLDFTVCDICIYVDYINTVVIARPFSSLPQCVCNIRVKSDS